MFIPEDDDDELEESELQILREAGVIAPDSSKRRRKSFKKRKPKHLVFVDTPEQGMSQELEIIFTILTRSLSKTINCLGQHDC